MIMMSRILRAAVLIAPLLLPTGALAKELCHLAGKDILGDQITMTLKWPIDPDRPPELLERPAEPSMDDLFSDAQGSGSEKAPCDGGSIVEALNCRVIGPMTDAANAPVDPGETETETSSKTAPAAPENAEGEKVETETAARDRDYDRYVYATIRMRPLIRFGQPPQVLMAHEETGLDFDTQNIDKNVVDRVNADLVETSSQIRSWSTMLDMETAADLAAGKPWTSLELAAMPDFKRSAGANLSMPDEMRFPEACGSLILIETQLADALTDLRPAQERLQRFQARKRDLQRADPDKIKAEIEALEGQRKQLRQAGLPTGKIDNQIKAAQNRLEEVENRDDIIEKLDTQIKIAGNKVRQLSEPVQSLEQRDIAQRKALNEEARLARLDAIRSDPKALEDEKLARLGEAMTAYRNFRTYEKKRAAAIEAYNQGLADFDKRIADAPDDETRSTLEDSKERFRRLYDQWTDHSRTVASRSFRDLDRMLEDNTRDGIGPTTIPGIVEDVKSKGVDAADYFEGYDPNEIDRARRIALSDAVTLGGEASNDSGTLQFLKDTSQALQEEREKIILTPSDVVDKLGQVARGETTLEEVLNDQKQFLERYGHYAKGTVIGGANGVKDLAVLAHDGLTYALETDEALLKSAYKAVTGEEIKGSYFGDRKHKALEKLTGSAADAVNKLLDRNNAKHGVRNDGQRVDIADVWDDPAKVGDFLGQTYGDYKRLGELSDQAIVSGSEMARDAADSKLASITKGGEKSLRGALGKTGEFVGEISDVGLAGLWALDKFGDAAKGLRRLEDGLDTAEDVALATDRARDVARTPVGDETVRLPEPDLPGTTSQPNYARAPPVEETARLADPDLPPASTADTPSARPVGDETARLSEPDLPGTTPQPRSQRAPQVEETARLADPDLPPASTTDTPSARPVGDETARLPEPDLPSAASQPGSQRAPQVEETARLADPDLPPASAADTPSARPVGDETARLPEPDLPSAASQPGSQRGPQVEETARLAESDLPPASTADPNGPFIGLDERLGPDFAKALDEPGTLQPRSNQDPILSAEADPKGPYIGLDERLGSDFQNALDGPVGTRSDLSASDTPTVPPIDGPNRVPGGSADDITVPPSRAPVEANGALDVAALSPNGPKGRNAEDVLSTAPPPADNRPAIVPQSNGGRSQLKVGDNNTVEFDEAPLGQGSFNTAFKIDEASVARMPGGLGGRPKPKEIIADKGGRAAFETAGVDTSKVRLVEYKRPPIKVTQKTEIPVTGESNGYKMKDIQLQPGDEIEIVENFSRGTLKDRMQGRAEKKMTAEEAIAYDKGVRELNEKGLVALDLKYDNFGFEPVSPGSKELRLVILDSGGIVPIKGKDGAKARRMQSTIDEKPISVDYTRLNKEFNLYMEFGDDLDVGAVGLQSFDEIPFNPLGVSSYEKGRILSSMTRAQAEDYYAILRAAE